jgi:hypothetical protein
MYIEELEALIAERLKGIKELKSVKQYTGELERESILQTGAGNLPCALIYTEQVTDGEALDQMPTEQVDIALLLLISTVRDNDIYSLRRKIKAILVGETFDNKLILPMTSVRMSTIAITPTVSVYAMHFKTELESENA